MNTTRLTAIVALAALAAWLWRLGNKGTDRVPVRPASPSVSWENYLEEAHDD